jgi:hypothetical protein
LGLLTGDNEYVECFTEAITGDAQVTGRHARQLFVTVIFEGASSIDLWRKFGNWRCGESYILLSRESLACSPY